MRNAYKVLVGKSEGKSTIERPRCSWGNNIKIELREVGWESVNWMHLAQDRDQWRDLLNTVMNFQVL
jgi:hypothetical protein